MAWLALTSSALSRQHRETVVFHQLFNHNNHALPLEIMRVWHSDTSVMEEPIRVSKLVEHLFRDESGKMVVTLCRIFGIVNLNLAVDVLNDAHLPTLQPWPYRGFPQNPI